MNITPKEIEEDYKRFLRQEAMRANCSQMEIIRIICKEHFEMFLDYTKIKEEEENKFNKTENGESCCT